MRRYRVIVAIAQEQQRQLLYVLVAVATVYANSRKIRMTRFAILLALVAANVAPVAGDAKAKATPKIDVLFSPKGGCTERIIQEIGKAEKTVQVQAYSFTSAAIAKALIEAKKRGVTCFVVLDSSQESHNYSELDFFFNQGIQTWIDDKHAIAHSKIIIIDDKTIITGSFNFSKAAEDSNAENLLVITEDDDITSKYSTNFVKHREHSRKYEGKTSKAAPRGPPSPEEISSSANPPKMPIPSTKATATDAQKKSATAVDETVYVTSTGAKYHRKSCSYLRKSAIPIMLFEAKARYGPCSRCSPPLKE